MPDCLDVELLRKTSLDLGVPLATADLALFERYAAAILAGNERLNLTRITSPDGMAVHHFADSLAVLRAVDEGVGEALRLVDVGTGAGLPGLALKIARPAWALTLVESKDRKCAFLREVSATLGLDDVVVLCARAEDVGRMSSQRESHDLGVARAVGSLAEVAEYVLPLVRTGGLLVAHRSGDTSTEVASARRALDVLGGRVERVEPYALPGLEAPRALVVVRKVAATPPAYPRRAGVPHRRPL